MHGCPSWVFFLLCHVCLKFPVFIFFGDFVKRKLVNICFSKKKSIYGEKKKKKHLLKWVYFSFIYFMIAIQVSSFLFYFVAKAAFTYCMLSFIFYSLSSFWIDYNKIMSQRSKKQSIERQFWYICSLVKYTCLDCVVDFFIFQDSADREGRRLIAHGSGSASVHSQNFLLNGQD